MGAGSTCPRPSGTRRTWNPPWRPPSGGDPRQVVIPGAVLRELEAHAREALPGEACGVLVLRDGVAERYERGRNRSTSDFRYELDIDPEVWFLEDDGYELAIFHSHPESAPRPSRTDIEHIGRW